MHTAFELRRTWSPQLPHTLVVVLTTVFVLVLAIALLVAVGLTVQDLTGGPPATPLQPEPGLDV